MSEDRTLKDRFSISADELEHRMQLQQKYHDEPIKQAVAILETALCKVMTKLGVDCDQPPDNIHLQQEALGITVWTEERDEMAGIQGYFIHVGYEQYIPYAWVGAARLNSNGECFCDIHWFNDERLDEIGGVRIIK